MNAPAFDWETAASPIFDAKARADFACHYPEVPHKLRHALDQHPLLTLDRLADLAEALPEGSVEYNLADLPIAVEGKPDKGDLPLGETIRQIGSSGSWAVLRNIGQDPEYAALLNDLLDEIAPQVEARTGPMLHRLGFIFVTSPGGVTPAHFDPEHNVLLQVRGSKTMTQFPAGDTRFVADEAHERYHTGGPREVDWQETLETEGTQFHIGPGEGLYVPVMAPHFVRNGPEPSISLSITWRSEWSYREADARAFNHVARNLGFSPRAPGRWPQQNRSKAFAYRAIRKLGLAGKLA